MYFKKSIRLGFTIVVVFSRNFFSRLFETLSLRFVTGLTSMTVRLLRQIVIVLPGNLLVDVRVVGQYMRDNKQEKVRLLSDEKLPCHAPVSLNLVIEKISKLFLHICPCCVKAVEIKIGKKSCIQ